MTGGTRSREDRLTAAGAGARGEVLLEVRDLRTRFPSDLGPVRAVDGVSFSVRSGERVGIVGESGSGKSVTALSIMGLVRTPPATVAGELHLEGIDLLSLSPRERRRLCGDRLAMVFQSPLGALNPTMTIGDQVVEAIRAHRRVRRRDARRQAVDLLAQVGLPDPSRAAEKYPHHFSGGMRQRAMIAIALSCDPDLLIADEPTTALDVIVQAQIVDLLRSLSEGRGMAVLLVTHDLSVLAGFAQRIVVMYAGRVVEEGIVEGIYHGAAHPYTWGLMASHTRRHGSRGGRLLAIEGQPPSAVRIPTGCAFHPRCRYATERCAAEVPQLVAHPGMAHPCACHYAGRLAPPAAARGGAR